jgi:oxygen-independent coproporphyrinogen-3 oxidase
LPPEGLYLHLPFCLSLCPYCDFVVVAGAAARGPRNRVAELVEAELVELDLRAGLLGTTDRGRPKRALDSVYLGGGTPSLLTAVQVARLLERVDERLTVAPGAEVTIEANPGADELGDLAGFRAAGVNRLSIGAQSLDDAALRRLGRRHRAGDVVAAVAAARAAGFPIVSLDLLSDIPGQSIDAWRASLEWALALEPEHLSMYTLALADPEADGLTGPQGDHLPVTRGARAWRERARTDQSEERAAEMEVLVDDLAEAAGLRRYEIANLARPGLESRHNLLYWRRRPHLAIGPGAHAFDGRRRRSWNAALLGGYLAAAAAGRLPPGGHDDIDAGTAIAEEAMLGLRLAEGIGPPLTTHPLVAPALAWGRDHGLVEEVVGARLTQTGRLLADEVFVRLFAAFPSARQGIERAAGSGARALQMAATAHPGASA